MVAVFFRCNKDGFVKYYDLIGEIQCVRPDGSLKVVLLCMFVRTFHRPVADVLVS